MTKPAPNDGTPLGHLSEAELVKEFARELARRRGGAVDLDTIESFASEVQRSLADETLGAAIAALPAEDGSAKPCPKCKQLVPVKVKNRVRHVLTGGWRVAGLEELPPLRALQSRLLPAGRGAEVARSR